MPYHRRGGFRAGAGRPAKAPSKLIRIEERLADKFKELTAKLESNYILSKWESIEKFLLDNQPLEQQKQQNKNLTDNLSKALLNDSLLQLLEKIFIKFSPDDFIAYWSDIDLTEIEFTPSELKINPTLDAPSLSKALENQELVVTLDSIFSRFTPSEFIDYCQAVPQKIESISGTELGENVTSEKSDKAIVLDTKLTKDATPQKSDKAVVSDTKLTKDATPQKSDKAVVSDTKLTKDVTPELGKKATPEKLDKVIVSDTDLAKNVTVEKADKVIVSDTDSTKNVTPEKANPAIISDKEVTKKATPEKLDKVIVSDTDLTKNVTVEKADKVIVSDTDLAKKATPGKADKELTKNAIPEKLDKTIVSDTDLAKKATPGKAEKAVVSNKELTQDVTVEKLDKAIVSDTDLTKKATPEKLSTAAEVKPQSSNRTKTNAKTVKPTTATTVEFSSLRNSDGNLLTKEQFNILEAVRDRLNQTKKKGLLIEALAGTGKSTMLAEIAKVLKSEKLSPLECRFVVFGRKNKADLANKLSEIKWEKSVQTLNSLGYEILREALGKHHKQFRLNNGKYEQIAQSKKYLNSYNKWGETIYGKLQTANQSGELAIKSKGDFVDLLDKMRLHCYFVDEITKDDVWEIANKYKIEIFKSRLSEITEAVCDVLETGLDEGIEKLNIDFLDQTWLLWHDQNMYRNIFKQWSNQLKVISIDECQDTDLLQIEFIKLLHSQSKNFIIAVGDRNQAIYSFRGAMTDGIDVIAKKFDCEKMPLTTNWRCGKKHLKLVRDIYPHINIKPSPTAPEGEIRIIKETHFLDIFNESDRSLSFFGICRKNAPLIIFAIRLLTAGYPARIKDRNLGAKLLNKVKEVVRGKYHVEQFLNQVEEWFMFQANSISKLPEKIQEQKLTELRDYRDCLVALFAKFQPKSLNDWKTEIDKIFNESITTKKIIDLYTIHSGKGGEGHYTFIIYPENMPIEFEKQSREEKEQEQHNIYVALTRCLARGKGGILWLVLGDKKGEVSWPTWLPQEYRKLWGLSEDNKDENEEIDDDICF